jgi:phosphoglycerate dehydrogenase-like enzyme
MNDPFVVGILYPAAWNPDLDAHLDELRNIDSRIETVVQAYEEPQELRSARGLRCWEQAEHLVPDLTDEQLAAFARIGCCVALDLPPEVGTVAPNLRWVQGVGAGVGQLISADLAAAGIRLTTAAGVNATGVAEFVMARILGEYKKVRALDAAQGRNEWTLLFGREIAGLTLGLIGFGAIGQRVAARAKAFDMHVIAVRQNPEPSDLADQVLGADQLHEMLRRCDVVVAAAPETSATEDLMDGTAFETMRRGSMFVNVGRGSLVVEPALINALDSGHLRAAALDVARIEPLPPDSPLWDAPNLYLSGHCASDPRQLFPNLHTLLNTNVARFLADEPLLNEQSL